MSAEDKQIETGSEGRSEAEELNQLKKEMAERVVDKMGENNTDFILLLGKDIVTDYLVDEGDDKFKDFLLGVGLSNFTEYSDQLKDLRQRINTVESKQELDDLERSVIADLGRSSDTESSDNEGENPQNNSEGNNGNAASVAGATTGVAAASTPSSPEKPRKDNYNDNLENYKESAPVGEAVEIPLNKRMKWLFPKGVPTKEVNMRKYITKITVPICTPEGRQDTLTLSIHKKLANEYQAIFQEMYDKGIPVNPESTGGYNWRRMRKGKKMSHHSYGTAVDVNWDVNGGVYGSTVRNSPYYNSPETVDIWKRHGFYWGGDWSKKNNDPMHFTYMNA